MEANIKKFAEMQDCMKEYPTLYKEKDQDPISVQEIVEEAARVVKFEEARWRWLDAFLKESLISKIMILPGGNSF